MDDVYKSLLSYYNVLPLTGYMSIEVVKKLLALDYITGLMEDQDFLLEATCEQKEIACKLYKCLTHNNCLL